MKTLKILNVDVSVYSFKSVELKFGINFDSFNDGHFTLDVRTKHHFICITK